MQEHIVNRVAKSPLITVDLEDFYPKEQRLVFDLKSFLFEDLILKENPFREALKNHDWLQYKNTHVAVLCSTEAIVPDWAYMLVITYLNNVSKSAIIGDTTILETVLYNNIINQLDVLIYKDKPIIIKGCSNKPIPQAAYAMLINKLQPIAKSIMYGEACSSVPLFKKSRLKK